MKFFTLGFAALLILSGCAMPPVHMHDPSLKFGQYKVTSVEVSAGPEINIHQIDDAGTLGVTYKAFTPEDLTVYKPMLEKAIFRKLKGKGAGREVKLSVKINYIHFLKPNQNKTLLFLGRDQNEVSGVYDLIDPKTGQTLGDGVVGGSGRNYGGLATFEYISLDINAENEAFVEKQAESIVNALYPIN